MRLLLALLVAFCSGYERGRRVGRDCLVDPLLLPSFLSERTFHARDACPDKGEKYPFVLKTNLSLTSSLCLYSSSGTPFTCDLSEGEGRNLLYSMVPPKEEMSRDLIIAISVAGVLGGILIILVAYLLVSCASKTRKSKLAGMRIALKLEADGMEEVMEVDPLPFAGRV